MASSVRHTRNGIDASVVSRSRSLSAAKSPSVRHSPGRSGGRHSRRRWPAVASSRARTASRARVSCTSSSGVPSGTFVVIATRYSIGGSSSAGHHRPRLSDATPDAPGMFHASWMLRGRRRGVYRIRCPLTTSMVRPHSGGAHGATQSDRTERSAHGGVPAPAPPRPNAGTG